MTELISWLNANPWWFAAFIVVARIIDVSLGTVRTICVVRGYRLIAAVLGFAEVMVWIVAVSGVLREFTLLKVLAYGVGFAAGNAVGIWMEQQVALGQQVVFVISKRFSHDIAFAMRLAGYMVTQLAAEGRDGPLTMLFIVTSRKATGSVMRIVESVDREAIAMVNDVRSTTFLRRQVGMLPPTGWRAILKKK